MAKEVHIRLTLTGGAQVLAGLQGISSAFSAMRSAIASSAVVLGALKLADFIGAAIESADAAGKMAQKVGINVEQLTALEHAAKLANVSSESLTAGIKNFSKHLIALGNDSSNTLEELIRVADQFSRMEDGANKTARAVELFGRSGIDLIPLLNQGSDALREQLEEARRFGVVVGPEFAAKASEFHDNLTRLHQILAGFALQIAEQSLPDLIRLSEAMVQIAESTNAVATAAERAAFSIRALAVAVQMVIEKPWMSMLHPAILGFMAGQKMAAQDFAGAIAKGITPTKSEMTKPEEPLTREADQKKAVDVRRGYLEEIYALSGQFRLAEQQAEDNKYAKEREALDLLLIDKVEKDQLYEQAKRAHLLRLAKMDSDYVLDAKEKEDSLHRSRMMMLSTQLSGTASIISSIGQIMAASGSRNFAFMKGLALAGAVINTAAAVVQSLASAPFPYNLIPAIASAAAGAAQIAQIAAQRAPSYAAGGFTGVGPRLEVAGAVHRGEFVIPAPVVQRVGLPTLEAIGAGIEPTTRTAAAPNVTVQGHSVAFVRGESEAREWLKTMAGKSQIYQIVREGWRYIGAPA